MAVRVVLLGTGKCLIINSTVNLWDVAVTVLLRATTESRWHGSRPGHFGVSSRGVCF